MRQANMPRIAARGFAAAAVMMAVTFAGQLAAQGRPPAGGREPVKVLLITKGHGYRPGAPLRNVRRDWRRHHLDPR